MSTVSLVKKKWPRKMKQSKIVKYLLLLLFTYSFWLTLQSNSKSIASLERLDLTVKSSNFSLSYDSGTDQFINKTDNSERVTPFISIYKNVQRSNDDERRQKKPVILMWTSYYDIQGIELMKRIISGRKWDPECCRNNAEITLDRERVEEATAIVFFNYFGNLDLNDLPKTRFPEQLWVLFSKESPAHTPPLGPYDNLFNLTMSYRWDSDIWSPYGEAAKLEKPLDSNYSIMIGNVSLDDWVAGKRKLLTGIISNCRTSSQRENIIKRIHKDTNTSVDIFGLCGTKICPRMAKRCDPEKVWNKISKVYKFYFAAENSICIDYITEKFWKPLTLGMVPVVYGGGNYEIEAPPGSFVDARDFKSPIDLVEFLQKLDEDDNEYKKYFEWRRRYTIRLTDSWQGWCKLCEQVERYVKSLNDKVSPPIQIIHKELNKWWNTLPTKLGDKPMSVCITSFFWQL